MAPTHTPSPAPSKSTIIKPKPSSNKIEKSKPASKPKAEKKARALKPKATKEQLDADSNADLEHGSEFGGDDLDTEQEMLLETPKPKKVTAAKKASKPKTATATNTATSKISSSNAPKDTSAPPKVKPITGPEAATLIRTYLQTQNRPYSATEVSANLHGKVTKTVAEKLLKEMDASGLIKAKATNGDKKGSQWVFWAVQDPADSATPDELTNMELTISHLRATLPTLKSTLKTHTTHLQTLKSQPTTLELARTIETLRDEVRLKSEKLRSFQEGKVKVVGKEEREGVERDWKYWGARMRGRRAAFENLEGVLREGMSREEIWEGARCEEVGFEG